MPTAVADRQTEFFKRYRELGYARIYKRIDVLVFANAVIMAFIVGFTGAGLGDWLMALRLITSLTLPPLGQLFVTRSTKKADAGDCRRANLWATIGALLMLFGFASFIGAVPALIASVFAFDYSFKISRLCFEIEKGKYV